ncbi:hypothetical protein [Streptomyces sp. NPDC086787]|uniref:hypothetical protein n=1 Tax=Streptomyces sp. NPDC086787 TaxID=3365759 RepID=UPI003817A251
MTQSGQGDSAREGIVLPSDGGEPLLPGMTGRNPAPAGGQAWGGPWGPEQQQGAGPLPAETEGQGASSPYAAQQPYGSDAQQQPSYGSGAQHQSSYGSDAQPQSYGSDAPQQQPYGSDAPQQQPYGSGTPQQQPYGSGTPQPQSYGSGAPQQSYGSAADAYPAAGGYPQADFPQAGYPRAAAPLPPTADGATQYLPPVPAAPANEAATQYIAPVSPGALPPETADDQTRFLGRTAPAGAAGHPDNAPTQYIPPVAADPYGGGDRRPPAEFDSLFRSEPSGPAPAGATQQMPRVPSAPNAYAGRPAPQYDHAQYDDGGHDGGDGGRTRSKVPLIAAIGVGIVVVGVGAGALLSGGGGDKGGQTDSGKNVAASAPATGDSASPAAADPARQQAVALDKLLADSGSSRASVIKAVADVKSCNNLGAAASDLRSAAQQRSGLVTRLSQLSVDKLPDNAALTSALTKAWQASASADNHYAAWAQQVSGKHGCKKGHARATGQTQAGNRESGVASTQKVSASRLWNAIANKYGLTQRQPTQL